MLLLLSEKPPFGCLAMASAGAMCSAFESAPRAALADAVDEQTLMVFLGINRRGKPLFAADISRLSNPEDDGPFRGMGVFEDLRALASAGGGRLKTEG